MICAFCPAENELVGHVLFRGVWVDVPTCSNHKHEELSDGLLEKLSLAAIDYE